MSSETTKRQTVKRIVAAYLRTNGYDGLVDTHGECGCELDDLFPCIDGFDTCEAAYRVPCNGDCCGEHGDCDFHMSATRPDGSAGGGE